MKDFRKKRITPVESCQVSKDYTKFVMVPFEEHQEMKRILYEMHDVFCEGGMKQKTEVLNGFISERDAKELTGRKTTWFWERRKSGKLPYKKLGATVYYKLEDLELLFD